MEKSATVATFNERAPAEAVANRLREAGFGATVYDESNEQKWKLFNLTPRAHLRVRVPPSESERAIEALRTMTEEPALAMAVRCPECGSSNIEFPQFSRRTLMGALPAALAQTGVIEQDFFCQQCQYTWPAEPPKAGPETDVLNWPKGKTF